MAEELNNNENINTDEGTTTYTQEQVDELLQKETDRRVTAALKKAEQKNAQKLREAEKLAQMNEADKYKYELEQREQAIAEKEKQLALAENKAIAGQILSEKGLSLDLIDFVVAEDADSMDSNIKRLEKAFRASVKAEVEKRIGSTVPKQSVIDTDVLTKEQFNKLSLVEQNRIFRDNPELYRQMTK